MGKIRSCIARTARVIRRGKKVKVDNPEKNDKHVKPTTRVTENDDKHVESTVQVTENGDERVEPTAQVAENAGVNKKRIVHPAVRIAGESRLDMLRKKAIKHNKILEIKRALLRLEYPLPKDKSHKVFEESHCLCCYQPMFDTTHDTNAIRSTMPCGHQLHTMCLVKWFSQKDSLGRCPICRV